ncbi:MAG: hypothetical protein A2Z35_02355 [Actinobacteria bacterium RBG_19FT_COMBO_36_27]|nr:MAG: hypothetical protein A2Z35_02355 [Actinobacteria bacterium RBG_19FT_COMBO_36_27]
MSTQIWDIESVIIGSFFIDTVTELKAPVSSKYPMVKKFLLNPEFDDKNKQTGRFTITITFEIDVKEDNKTKDLMTEIADTGRDIFNTYIDILSFLSVHTIYEVKQPVLRYNYPGTNKYKIIEFPTKQANVRQPVSLKNTSIFTKELEQKHRLILKWLRRALQEKDIINSILSSFISLEILANQFPCDKKLYLKCEKCGYIKESHPGMRIQIENLLINELGYTNELFKKIWELRNDIFHGNLEITTQKVRDLNLIRQDIIFAIINGMNKLLGIAFCELPAVMPPFGDPFIIVEYTL